MDGRNVEALDFAPAATVSDLHFEGREFLLLDNMPRHPLNRAVKESLSKPLAGGINTLHLINYSLIAIGSSIFLKRQRPSFNQPIEKGLDCFWMPKGIPIA